MSSAYPSAMRNSTLSPARLRCCARRRCALCLGVSLTAVVARLVRLLAAYLASDPAKERGVTATYLLTGYLKRDQEKNGAEPDAMDLDEPGATPSSQNGANGQDDAHRESVKTKTIMIVHEDELQGQSPSFLALSPEVCANMALQFPVRVQPKPPCLRPHLPRMSTPSRRPASPRSLSCQHRRYP